MSDILDIENLKQIMNDFAVARDWSKFHNPKNLAMALAVEAGELLEIFQWMSDIDVKHAKDDCKIVEQTSHELADVILYLIRIADLMKINLSEAILQKMSLNNKKYPVELVKGSSKKYTQYFES